MERREPAIEQEVVVQGEEEDLIEAEHRLDQVIEAKRLALGARC